MQEILAGFRSTWAQKLNDSNDPEASEVSKVEDTAEATERSKEPKSRWSTPSRSRSRERRSSSWWRLCWLISIWMLGNVDDRVLRRKDTSVTGRRTMEKGSQKSCEGGVSWNLCLWPNPHIYKNACWWIARWVEHSTHHIVYHVTSRCDTWGSLSIGTWRFDRWVCFICFYIITWYYIVYFDMLRCWLVLCAFFPLLNFVCSRFTYPTYQQKDGMRWPRYRI